MLGDKASVSARAPLDKSLRLVDKRVRKRIATNVGNREGLPLLFESEVHTAGRALDAAFHDRARQTHPVAPVRGVQGLIFRNGVIVGLALAIAQPGKKRQGHDYDTDADPELRPILHKAPLTLRSQRT